MPIQVQCKTQTRTVNYVKLFSQMPPGNNVIMHQYTRKSDKGGRFIPKGEYVILEMDFFLQLLESWQSESQTSTEE